jgi:hypothetical protein
MDDESQGWDRSALLRLRDAILGLQDEEIGKGFPEADYDAPLGRAEAAAKRLQARRKKEDERRERAIEALREPTPERPFWRYRGLPACEAYLVLSFEERYRDPRRMLSFAQAAHRTALEVRLDSYPPGIVQDLRARACAELANACRVNELHAEAELHLAEARDWLDQGSRTQGLLARVLDVEASLRIEQRRFPEALSRLAEARELYLEVGDGHLAGRTLISRSRALYTAGDPQEAIRLLEEGRTLLDPVRDPALFRTCTQALLMYLVESGQYSRALALFLESGLGKAFAAEPLNALRLRWVKAKIDAGIGRLKRAEAALLQVREGFQELSLHYDAALAGLDLAAVWYRQGEHRRLLPLAVEMSTTFERLKLHREALKALIFFENAVEFGAASVPVIERTRRFLSRLPSEPDLVFDIRATLFG